MLADGNGLYLQVTRANAWSWIFRYRNSKSREMGLGSLNAVSLAGAIESGGVQAAARPE
jgi:Arm domain-containing DNA-binding protein